MNNTKIADAIDHVRSGDSPVEIIWSLNPDWPFNTSTPKQIEEPIPAERGSSTLLISVLDSSFNPPTLAHKELALSKYPTNSSGNAYQARLLLLSVRNADKVLKHGDATFVQRVEMMIHLAEDLAESHQAQPSVNIAVAVIDEPSFVGKSIKLQPYLRSRVPNETRIKLAFVLGTDTITRFFAPRFYPSLDSMLRSIRHFFLEPAQGGEGSEIVCARRSSTLSEEEEQEFLQTEEVKEWVDVGAVKLIDIGEEEAKMSSTKVREGIKNYETLQWISRWEDMCCPSVANYIKDQHLYSIE